MLRLTKHHGLGNDFLVALALDNPGLEPRAEVARALCDRRRGVGADGLIHGLEPGAGAGGDVRMVLLNADGSRAEISGNGLRCLGQAVLRHAGREEGAVVVDTDAGPRRLDTVGGDVDGELWIRVDLGAPAPGPEWSAEGGAAVAPGAGVRAAVTVDMGNPHVVLLVDDADAVDLAVVGPALEAAFPAGANVHAVSASRPDRLELRVWERGAGLTQACGSGAAAAVVAANALGAVDGRVEVAMPGGSATVELVDGRVLLTGPTVLVAEVVVP